MPNVGDEASVWQQRYESQLLTRPTEVKPYDCYVGGLGHVVIDATSPSTRIEQLETRYGVGKPGRDDFAFRIPAAHHKSGDAYRGSDELIAQLKQHAAD